MHHRTPFGTSAGSGDGVREGTPNEPNYWQSPLPLGRLLAYRCLMRGLFGTGLLAAIAVIFSMITMRELVLGGRLRWVPTIIYVVILAPVLLTLVGEAKRIRG